MLTTSQTVFIIIGVGTVSHYIMKIILWLDEPHHRKEN